MRAKNAEEGEGRREGRAQDRPTEGPQKGPIKTSLLRQFVLDCDEPPGIEKSHACVCKIKKSHSMRTAGRTDQSSSIL